MDNVTIEIIDQINKAKLSKFTGKMTITINMNCGGIGQVSLNKEQNLKNFAKNKTFN